MIWAIQRRRKFRFSRSRRVYAPRETMSRPGEEPHPQLDQFHGGICDWGDAFRALAQHSLDIRRIRYDFAVPLLEWLEMSNDHLGNLFFEIAVPHAGEVRSHLFIIPA